MRVVILGGGFGGVYTAQFLLSKRLFARRLSIVLITRNPYFEFKPLFTEVLGGRLPPESARYSLKSILESNSCRVKIASVTGIDAKKRVVETDTGNVRFDYLVIALGGSHELVPITRGTSFYSLESLDDCVRLRDRVSELGSGSRGATKKRGDTRNALTVLGAGPTGVEAATEISHVLCAVRDSGKTTADQTKFNINLIEARDHILPGWGKSLRARALSILKECGINVITGASVTRIAKQRVYLRNRKPVMAGTVIWCGGLRGSPIYESAGASLDEKDRLRVNPYLQVPRFRNIYAMGDAINTEAFATPVPQSAQAAYQQARVIAHNVLSSETGRRLIRFAYFQLGEVMPVGGRQAIAQMLGIPLEGSIAWLLEKAIIIARIPGWENKATLVNGLAVDPLVERGEKYLEKRGW